MPTEKMAVGIWTVRMLTKLNNRVKKTIVHLDFLGSANWKVWLKTNGIAVFGAFFTKDSMLQT